MPIVRTVIIVEVAAVAIAILLEVARAPWARSLGLWPTLTGDWAGELKTEDSRAQPVFLAIRGRVPRRGLPYIRGRARLCDRDGSIRDFDIWGEPDNWRGTRLPMSMKSLIDHDTRLGPGDMLAEWNGDEIRAIGVLISRAPSRHCISDTRIGAARTAACELRRSARQRSRFRCRVSAA